MGKNFWNKNWGKDNICGITYSRLRPGKNSKGVYYTTSLKCGHRFCTYPLLNWIKNNNGLSATCPTCMYNFNLIDIIK